MSEVERPSTPGANQALRTVYVLAHEIEAGSRMESIGLLELWDAVRRGRWFILAVTTAAVAAAACYAFLSPQWFRSTVVLSPSQQQATSGLAGQLGGLGGLASLAGIEIGSGNDAEAVAILRSRDLAKDLILSKNLLPVIFSEHWDVANARWAASDEAHWPDVRDAVKVFDERIRLVQADPKTGLVTLQVSWHDPVVAAEWAGALVQLTNERLRERDLRESEVRVAFLRGELAGTAVVTIHESLARLLETEMQKLMLVRGRQDYAFRVIDGPDVPKRRYSPKRIQMILMGALAGAMTALLLVLLRTSIRRLRDVGR